MLIEKIIKPSDIECTLKEIWENFGKTKKVRASLFTLIVFNEISNRSDYLRNIILQLIEKYPCRIIFISYDKTKNDQQKHLKTAVSIISPKNNLTSTACDNIDVVVSKQSLRIIPFIVLPHILPDLPVYLLWPEDITTNKYKEIFNQLQKLSTRVIFDSEGNRDLPTFAKEVLQFSNGTCEVADLNWARIENWRDLISTIFYSPSKLQKLREAKTIEIEYNADATKYFCHEKIKPLYLQAWIASAMGWRYDKIVKNNNTMVIHYNSDDNNQSSKEIKLIPQSLPHLITGSISSVKILSKDSSVFNLQRSSKTPYQVKINISSKNECEIPYNYIFGHTISGYSLIKEIFHRKTSSHYIAATKLLSTLKIESLC